MKDPRNKIAISHLIAWIIVYSIFFLSHELDKAFNLYILLVPIVLLPFLIMVIVMLVSWVRSAWLGRWLRFSSILAAPLIVAGVAWALNRFEITAEWTRFQLSRRYYLAKIVSAPRTNDEPLFAMFDWGESGGAGVSNVIDTLIYDETDQIGLPDAKRSVEWKQRMEKGRQGSIRILAPETGHVHTTAFGQHFFLVRLVW
jgi:hypothetical protein